MPGDYGDVLSEIKRRISKRRTTAFAAANAELVMLYWEIGGVIRKKVQAGAWGTGVVERLAKDLREAHPQMTGLSSRNLRHMAKFAGEFADPAVVKQAVSQLPWATSSGSCSG